MPDVLLATDADWIHADIDAALGGSGTTVRRVRAGVEVLPAMKEAEPDLVVLDMQIGNMGGIACCTSIRLEEGVGRLPYIPILILLDRDADLFLARRCDASGWLIKPLDSFRIRRAADALLAGDEWHEAGAHTPMGTADAPEAV